MADLPIDELRNPDYGRGVYRRRIAVDISDKSRLYGALEDEAHAFEITMSVEGRKITSIDAVWRRHPTTTCSNANEALQALVGKTISSNPLSLSQQVVALDNCTHFFDMAALLAHTYSMSLSSNVQPPRTSFVYAISVGDATLVDGKELQQVELLINDDVVEKWSVENGVVTKPDRYTGQRILKGLISWGSENLDHEALMRTILIQKGYFVSGSRRFLLSKLAGFSCLETQQPVGVCYAMRHGREQISRRTDMRKSYSDSDEGMLAFIPEKIKIIP